MRTTCLAQVRIFCTPGQTRGENRFRKWRPGSKAPEAGGRVAGGAGAAISGGEAPPMKGEPAGGASRCPSAGGRDLSSRESGGKIFCDVDQNRN